MNGSELIDTENNGPFTVGADISPEKDTPARALSALRYRSPCLPLPVLSKIGTSI